jgi:hypothetical protein
MNHYTQTNEVWYSKRSFMGIPTSFISVVTSLDEAFIYGGCGVIY